MPHFYKRAVITLMIFSVLMFATLTAALMAWRENDKQQKSLAALSDYQSQVAVLEKEGKAYQTLVAKLGWTPGTELRRETVDSTALYRGGELDKINGMLAVTYSGRGFFALNRLSIEDAGVEPGLQGNGPSVRVTLNGESVMLVDKRR
jgi:hypothetical protein